MKKTEQEAEFMHLTNGGTGLCSPEKQDRKERDLLASRLKSGHEAASVALVNAYYKQMYLFMRRLGHDHQSSEDLTQETFIQAWQHIGQLRDGKALNSWLYRIAANTSGLYWRKHKGVKAVGLEDIDVLDNGSGSGHEIAVNAEELVNLKKAVSELSVKLREVIVFHYFQQLTISESARALGIREGTFKSRLSRALKALKKRV